MPTPRITPSGYRRVTALAVFALYVIIVTGGVVRLTGSGLGCPDWPTCANGRYVAPLEFHRAVENINRLITGLVSVAVVVAVLGSLWRRPRRTDLIVLSLGLVAGVIGQIVLGGLVVLSHLFPPFVMGHFVLSLLILWCALVLHHRAGAVPGDDAGSGADPSGPEPPSLPPNVIKMSRLLLVAVGVVVVLGTVVTGSGPHPGSNGTQVVDRLPLSLHDAARLHGVAVLFLIAGTVAFVRLLMSAGAPRSSLRRAEVFTGLLVAQAGVGYVQYFTRLPALLVAVHVAGAAAVWAGAVWLSLGLTPVPARSRPGPDPVLVTT